MPDNTLLKAENLSIGYGGVSLVEGVNFSVSKGDYLFILGENGSGKTTLMKTLLGLIPPIDGKISFEGGLKKYGIGYLPQQSAAQKNFPATVSEVVLSGTLRRGSGLFINKEKKKRALYNMQRLKIDNIKNHSYKELSGGQQQRVLLTRALCAADNMLLLDEPASGLDIFITKELYEIVDDLNKSGMTIIMISHDMSAAVKYAKSVLHISKEPSFFSCVSDYKAFLETRKGEYAYA